MASLDPPTPWTAPRAWAAPAAARLAPALAVLALAVALRGVYDLPGDVSWLLTLGERLLAGERPYVDFVEANPPASILLYVPAILAARLAGVAPEAMVVVLVFVLGCASLVLSLRILAAARLVGAATAPWLAAAGFAVFLVLPTSIFAQREHVAAIAVLPMLAVLAARRAGCSVSTRAALAAGLAAGLAVAVKPHFALALALPLGFVLARPGRSLGDRLGDALRPETVAAAAMVLAYAAAVVLAFPAFLTDTLPLLQAVYLPVRLGLLESLLSPAIALAWLALAAWVLLGWGRRRDPVETVSVLAACGFAAAALVQGKGWSYQAYPAVAFALLACLWRLFVEAAAWRRGGSGRPEPRLLAAGACLIVLGVAALVRFADDRQLPAFTEVVRRLAPAHPSMVLIGHGLGVGHPLVRRLQGVWVDPMACRWISGNAALLLGEGVADPERRQAIEGYARLDRERLVAAIERFRPDVVLVQDETWRAWVAAHAEVAGALAPYRVAQTFGGVSIMLRRDGAAAGGAG
ncbi:hypothetical protein [Labrys wisconsinensis]|uniref:Glycosyltransferase RgtA/B/C/D-like domain-containing protein n=1 Tax=Labrys wisconsinensis TaxID=425677 RepID=A0ABU0JC71_9HYPH|nr:hypothetical protein [Labrys wisconsinensis]MDQ0471180.1 hypothetical protein [Labrys wisconsinensis]